MRTLLSPLFRLFVLFLLVAIVRVPAQTPGTGAVAGTVMDATGAVIGAAKVEVVSEATKAARIAATASAPSAYRYCSPASTPSPPLLQAFR